VREKGRPNTPAFSTSMSNFLHINHLVSVFNNISLKTKFVTLCKKNLEKLVPTYLAKKFPAYYGM
jgi:hypothetical protein